MAIASAIAIFTYYCSSDFAVSVYVQQNNIFYILKISIIAKKKDAPYLWGVFFFNQF